VTPPVAVLDLETMRWSPRTPQRSCRFSQIERLLLLSAARTALYGAHQEDQLRGAPGQLLAQRDGAVCVATIDGSIWISHLKQNDDGEGRGIKLPATMALGMRASRLPHSAVPAGTKTNHRTFREIHYDEKDGVGYVSFDFYNGALSTGQCNRLRNAFLFARRQPTKVIVLIGGCDFFSPKQSSMNPIVLASLVPIGRHSSPTRRGKV
jgi:hypothetical protein